jgi:hypothetical protein
VVLVFPELVTDQEEPLGLPRLCRCIVIQQRRRHCESQNLRFVPMCGMELGKVCDRALAAEDNRWRLFDEMANAVVAPLQFLL